MQPFRAMMMILSAIPTAEMSRLLFMRNVLRSKINATSMEEQKKKKEGNATAADTCCRYQVVNFRDIAMM